MRTGANLLSDSGSGHSAALAPEPENSAALLRKIAELEQFAYVAAHDLQEPLRMMIGFTRLLAEQYGGTLDPHAAGLLNYALEGSRRLQDLLDGLLLLACADSREDLRRATGSGEAVRVALANLRLAIEESRATIRLGNLPEVWADPAQLARLFQNLIGNSIRYRSERPLDISVECRERARDWLFRVADNGRGFATQPTTGLGLEICRRITERHAGRLWFESPGVGAVACFTLARFEGKP